MWVREGTKDHHATGVCDNLQWDLVDFEPRGIVSCAVLMCVSCGYRSLRTKLYEEVPSEGPGRKAASRNVRPQLVLQYMTIGPTEARLIFPAVGSPIV